MANNNPVVISLIPRLYRKILLDSRTDFQVNSRTLAVLYIYLSSRPGGERKKLSIDIAGRSLLAVVCVYMSLSASLPGLFAVLRARRRATQTENFTSAHPPAFFSLVYQPLRFRNYFYAPAFKGLRARYRKSTRNAAPPLRTVCIHKDNIAL